MKKYLILLILISIFCFSEQPLTGQLNTGTVNPIPEKFEIYVSVSCKDEITKGVIESYIKRELRSLGDVNIRKKLGHPTSHGLHLVVTEHTFKNTGTKTGLITIATTYTKQIYPYPLLTPHISKDKAVELLLDDVFSLWYSDYLNTLLTSDQKENLQENCKEIVAYFDTSFLEKEREKR